MQAVTVLLVDDELDFARTLAMRLKAAGFKTETAGGGPEALEKLDKSAYDVILLDLGMPDMDGLEVLAKVKQRNVHQEVVVLTAKGTEARAIEAMRQGAYDFLVKPPEIESLSPKLREATQRSREHQARVQSLVDAQAGALPTDAETASVVATAEEKPRLLAISSRAEFSPALVEYTINMARRMAAEVIAVNAAGFASGTFKAFPSARESVCKEYKDLAEAQVSAFQDGAAQAQLSFRHVVMYVEADDAIREISREIGQVDFVLSESEDDAMIESSEPTILVYTPV